MTYPRFSARLEPWNPLLKSMHRGEVRRVWLTLPGKKEPLVYDIRLALVVRTDASGDPIVEND